MQKRIITVAIFAAMLPVFASAQAVANQQGTIGGTIDNIAYYIGQLLKLALPAAIAVFFWGLIKFMKAGDSQDIKKEGKKIMINSGVALFLMVGIWSVLGYLSRSVGLGNESIQAANNAPGINDIIPK